MGGKPSKGTRKDRRLAENRRSATRSGPQAKSSGPTAASSGPSATSAEQDRDHRGRFD